ncbi:MAG: hypothetical protein ACI87H_001297 [Gammaproteobacteria bacterium]|jgi:uncharacterized protein (DUF983 family)
MNKSEDKNCPNCGKEFEGVEVTFWNLRKDRACPSCGTILRTDLKRLAMSIVIILVGAVWTFESLDGYTLLDLLYWIIFMAFIVFGFMLFQKIENENKP